MRGELVGMLADRSLDERKCVRVPFLGAEASFPLGPLMVAASLSVPVLLFFGIRTGPRRYRVEFVPLAERIAVPRGERAAALERAVARYASELEARVPGTSVQLVQLLPVLGREAAGAARAVPAPRGARFADARRHAGRRPDRTPGSTSLMRRLAAIPAREASFTEEQAHRRAHHAHRQPWNGSPFAAPTVSRRSPPTPCPRR